MRRTSIKPKRLHTLAQEYLSANPLTARSSQGGRPRTYDDALILTIACIQNLNSYSFCEALEYCEDHFPDLPALSSYHERLSKFTSDIAQGFIAHIGKRIVSATPKNTPHKGRVLVMDGTGFSYHDVYPMKLYLGTEIRKIRTHVKIAALMGFAGTKRFVVSAHAGKAYAGDTTLTHPQLEALPKGRGAILGDKGFDSVRIMHTIKERGYDPVIPIKRSRFPRAIKDPLRAESAHNAQRKIYEKRPLIEGLFGNVKQKLSSHIKVFKIETAKLFALLRFALLNISVLVTIERTHALWLWFPNRAIFSGALSMVYKQFLLSFPPSRTSIVSYLAHPKRSR